MKYMIVLLLVVSLSVLSAGKREKAQAYDIGHEAIQLIEKGKYDRAMDLLNKAMELDPEHWLYPYEYALCLYQLEKNEPCRIMLDSLVKHGIENPRIYQLLGNCEAKLGNFKRSVAIYENGIKKYPDAGRLYMELALSKIATEEYDEAETLFETGIIVQPALDLNYYHLAKYYHESNEIFWSAYFAENYLLLTYDSFKFEEISKLLWKNYKYLAKNKSDLDKYLDTAKNLKPITKYVASLKKELKPFKTIEELTKIRKKLVEGITKDKELTDYGYFKHLKAVLSSNHLQEYDFWIFAANNISELQSWFKNNSKKYIDFEKWNQKNRLKYSQTDLIITKNQYLMQNQLTIKQSIKK